MLDILKNPHDAKEQEKTAALKEFQGEIAEITRLSKAELPRIGAAWLDRWIGENLAGIAQG